MGGRLIGERDQIGRLRTAVDDAGIVDVFDGFEDGANEVSSVAV